MPSRMQGFAFAIPGPCLNVRRAVRHSLWVAIRCALASIRQLVPTILPPLNYHPTTRPHRSCSSEPITKVPCSANSTWRDLRTTKQGTPRQARLERSEEHTSELQSLMRPSYAVFCLKKKHTEKLTIN